MHSFFLRHIVVAISSFAILAALVACQGIPKYGQTYGDLMLSKPRIQTRESLVADRAEQLQWLKSQLDTPPQFGLQGTHKTKQVTQIKSGVDVNAGIPQLPKLLSQQNSKMTDKGVTLSKPELIEAQVSADTNESEVQYQQVKKHMNSTEPGNSEATQNTTPGVHPIADFEDQLSYRDRIRNEINQTRLDFTHDIAGRTLIQLDFDATILPENDTSAWAQYEITLEEGSSEKQVVFKRWANTLEAYMNALLKDGIIRKIYRNEQLAGIVNEYFHRFKSTDEKIKFINTHNSYYAIQLPKLSSCTKTHLPNTEDFETDTSIANNTLITKINIARGIIFFFLKEHNFDKYVSVHIRVNKESKFVTIVVESCLESAQINTTTDCCNINQWHSQLLNNFTVRPNVYAVTPRETSQRISDIASVHDTKNFSMAAQILATGAGGKAYLDYVKGREDVFHAIKRKPITVGYNNAESDINSKKSVTFGWVVGPIYGITHGMPNNKPHAYFRHQTAHRSLSAMLSIPAWWDKIKLMVNRNWISDKDGERVSVNGSQRSTVTYEIEIPSDPMSMIAKMTGLSNQEPRADLLLPDEVAVTAGIPASLLITGDNLWRDTVVTIGAQSSIDIKVLPDMKGIIAKFSAIEFETVNCKKIQKTNHCESTVKVWTSAGAEYAGKVSIIHLDKTSKIDSQQKK